MAQYNLGAMALTTSPARDRFAALRGQYMELGEKHRSLFAAKFAACKTADDLFRGLPDDIEAVLAATTAKVASDLADNGIFDVSEKVIRADLEARAELVADRLNQVQDRYYAIIGKAAELEAQRQEARDNRGRIVGGGFGVQGAAQGIAIAAVANAAIGLTHGLANSLSKAASDLGDKEKKRELLTDPATKAGIGDFLIRIALQGAELVAATVNGGATFEAVTDDARQKSLAIVENVAAGRVRGDQVQSVLVQALTLDPFNADAWTGWLDRFGDQDGSVGASADALGIGEVKSHKAKLVAQHKGTLSWGTPEECRANSPVLEKYAESLGYAFHTERNLIEARAAKLDRERRTFNGTEYPSLAEATEARRTHDDMVQRTVAGVVHDTHESAEGARALIRTRAIASSRASSFFGWLTLAYRRCRDTRGRSSRKEFWMFALSALGIFAAFVSILDNGPLPAAIGVPLLLLYLLLVAATLLTVQIRRFHDQDRSGWFVLLNLIPYVGWAIVLAFMLVGGTPGDNRFGPSPKRT